MALDKRIIAIAVSPRAYDEILRLKAESGMGWTKFILTTMLAKGDNTTLQEELASLTKEPKEQKPKAEKKAKKGKTKVEAVETEVPLAEEAERVKVEDEGTLIMPHTHKPKKAKTEKSEEV